MVRIILIVTVLILSMSTFLFSQENQVVGDQSMPGQMSYTQHHIGINASKFFILFNEQVNNLDISYRYAINSTRRIRLSTSLDISTEEGDFTDYEIRVGYDFNYKETDRWRFYPGADVTFGQGILRSAERVNTTFGLLTFFGIQCKLGKHFSLSTEPSLALYGKIRKDPNSFDPDANDQWMEVKLLNMGQVIVGFHF